MHAPCLLRVLVLLLVDDWLRLVRICLAPQEIRSSGFAMFGRDPSCRPSEA